MFGITVKSTTHKIKIKYIIKIKADCAWVNEGCGYESRLKVDHNMHVTFNKNKINYFIK